MFDCGMHEPQAFVEHLEAYRISALKEQSQLANKLSDAIIGKRVDLSVVRQILLDNGRQDLMETLDHLLEVIEPYIEEGGVHE